MTNLVKKCPDCGNIKEFSEFHKNNATKCGRAVYCKVCAKKKQDNKIIEYKKYQKEYRTINKEELKLNKAKYYQNNKEELSIEQKQYYDDNKEAHAIRSAIYYQKNKEEIKNRVKEYQVNNKDSKLMAVKRRKLLKKGVTVEKFEKIDIINRYGSSCFYCEFGKFEHIDHYIPLSKGGMHSLANVRPSCASRNMRKSDKLPEDFIRLLGNK